MKAHHEWCKGNAWWKTIQHYFFSSSPMGWKVIWQVTISKHECRYAEIPQHLTAFKVYCQIELAEVCHVWAGRTAGKMLKYLQWNHCFPWYSYHPLLPLDLYLIVRRILSCQQPKATAGEGYKSLIYSSVSFPLNLLVPVSCEMPEERARALFFFFP